jgi:hypothetical protein
MAVGFPAKTNFATGDVLTATNVNDITGTLNLLQSTLYPAGRNKIINGDFNINQRSFTSSTTNAAYGFDRWRVDSSDGTVTYSAQTFTTGTAPVTGYEAANFARVVTTGQTATTALAFLNQRIESVRTFANETVVISFWAKAATGTPKVSVELDQQFGSGGSTRVTTYAGQVTLSTSWARYSVSVAVPSLSGKTIGTPNWLSINLWVSAGTDFNSRTGSMGIQTGTFDFWGVQVEAASTGSTASPFQTASGSIAGELALCQRYYWRNQATGTASQFYIGAGTAATTAQFTIPISVKMRANANPLEYSTLALSDGIAAAIAVTSLAIGTNSDQTPAVIATVASGLTANRPYWLVANASANAYVAFSAEL